MCHFRHTRVNNPNQTAYAEDYKLQEELLYTERRVSSLTRTHFMFTHIFINN